ncbi:hypothetical protein ACL02U_29370, partial [Streptomyces sp. MS06]|uniref:hypothetical protein n=1 Tax=Streptomyces sp. MS06 TaxID=3385974 RepID=UPI0039A245D5
PTPPVGERTLCPRAGQPDHRLKKQYREEVQAVRDALGQAHGENLDLRRELVRRGCCGMQFT